RAGARGGGPVPSPFDTYMEKEKAAMRWSAGWHGSAGSDRRPAAGRAVPGLREVWTCGWPEARVRAVGEGPVALAVIGECGADDAQLWAALPVVRAGAGGR
ncbi:hypothetical protein ACFWOI_46865, partial [Streptomyces sp. NPDC058424]